MTDLGMSVIAYNMPFEAFIPWHVFVEIVFEFNSLGFPLQIMDNIASFVYFSYVIYFLV
jgi:hypothetical protein